ncbi:RNApii degradation factor def1 protein [Rutstroemia sp. NJR-2017a BVV2]|nr:RNApii degradation factor def1 protein [Rutstroemia sp. NJR-2017a BVV2]
MSEVQARPAPRGRGSARGGRGGFAPRAGRGGGRGHATNGDKPDTTTSTASIDDNGEVGQLKKKHGSKVSTIQEMFPDWTDEDVVMALEETNGDLEGTVERITDGTISQWGAVSNSKKDRSKSKAHDSGSATALGDSTNVGRGARGGRGGFEGRGRGRGNDRGRGGRARGTSTTHTNGTRKENSEVSVPTTESNAWETAKPEKIEETSHLETAKSDEAENSGDTTAANVTSAPAAAVAAASSIIPDGVKKSWASMFAPAPKPKKAPEPVEKPAEPPKQEEPVEEPAPAEPEPPAPEPQVEETPEPTPVETPAEPEVVEADLTPSKDELTETNLEQVPDESIPQPSATAASTAASSWDPRSTAGTSTPYSALQTQPSSTRPPASGFQASALKATGSSGRTPSFQRRVLDQEEAVRMPGNREVDRAAVQFGAFNLNGSGDEDVDGDREEPETRAQPPQHSPVAPRATLPPAPQQAAPVPETLPTPKQSAGLPAATHPTAVSQQAPQTGSQSGQYGRYGQPGSQEQSSLPQKPYDAFSQQAPTSQSPFEGYPSQSSQAQTQPPSGAFSSAPNDYSSYYTADPQRQSYNSYYQQQYGLQQGGQGQQDASAPQRSYSGYSGPQSETSQFPQSSGQQAQSRYATAGEGQNSGHTTPNPVAQSQQQNAGQTAQPQSGHPQQPQQGSGYPYGHPYYSSPYYAAYMNQFQQYGAGSYGAGPYGAKGGIHAQPYQGYMSPGAPYDHSSSPAAGGFVGSSLHGRDSALGGGLGDYGRAGSAQSSQAPQALGGSGAFGGVHDAFSRGSYPSNQHYNGPQGSQPGSDDLKPFGESKAANGPSPSLSQAGRPGSATNTAPGSVLPPPQSQQGGYGGYPSHVQQGHGLHGSQAGSQYGSLGGGGGHQGAGQGHQTSGYGGYQGFGGNYYGNSQQRGGWGGNYGH